MVYTEYYKYEGVAKGGLDFYNLLMESHDFTSELGKISLACGKLEVELKKYLEYKLSIEIGGKSPLGSLINLAEKHPILENNMLICLKLISAQRNYMTHNIYLLFATEIEETLLEKHNLLDSDVNLYIERAWQLKDNIEEIADIFKRKNKSSVLREIKKRP